jgi:arylsulfatase A-like enzyme
MRDLEGGSLREILDPALRRALLVLCAALAVGCRAPHPAKNAILISIDTLRPDHLGIYGHERPTSPNLDAFAAGGVVFEQALSTAPWTLPAHVSMLTVRYPARHAVRTHLHRLRRDVPTLAGWLGAHGFATAAFFNSHFLLSMRHDFGAAQYVREHESSIGDARRVTQLALDWLEARRGERFFLFLHFLDVHSDYVADERYERMFTKGAGRLKGRTQELAGIRKGEPVTAGDVEHLARLYDAGIRQLDDDLVPLFDWLGKAGRLEDTAVVVTSDHGEEFLEHGSVLHDHTHYEELLRVPLILRGASIPAGLRIPSAVSLTDVMPTFLGLLDVPPPEGMQGRDLRGSWRSREPIADERALFAETSPMGEDALRSIRMGRHKLIHDRRTGRVELYDLEEDPGETRDLSSEQRDLVERLSSALEAFQRDPLEPEAAPPPSKEDEERLRALGYL